MPKPVSDEVLNDGLPLYAEIAGIAASLHGDAGTLEEMTRSRLLGGGEIARKMRVHADSLTQICIKLQRVEEDGEEIQNVIND